MCSFLTGCLALTIFGGVCLSVDAILTDDSPPPPVPRTDDEIWADLESGYIPHE